MDSARFALDAAGAPAAPLPVYPPIAAPRRVRLAHALADAWIAAWPLRGGPWLARQCIGRLLPRLPAPSVCPTLLGFDLVVGPGDGNYYHLGAYERGTLHVMSACLRPGDVFVDIGASIGQMALHGSTRVGAGGRVLAFEPHPARFAQMAAAVALNGRGNVTAFRMGLGEAEAHAQKLYCDRVSPSLVAVDDGVAHEDYTLVDIARLDALLAREGVERVRMMKIDVEGFEPAVLRGAGALLRGADAPIICIEHGGLGADDPLAALRLLREANDYGFYNLRGSKERRSRLVRVDALERLRVGDNVFCLREAHRRELDGSGLFA